MRSFNSTSFAFGGRIRDPSLTAGVNLDAALGIARTFFLKRSRTMDILMVANETAFEELKIGGEFLWNLEFAQKRV